MGCKCLREEERAQKRTVLLYEEVSAQKVDYNFHKTRKDYVSKEELFILLEKGKLATPKGLPNEDQNKIEKFYSHFYDDNQQKYSIQKINFAGIILSNSLFLKKALLIFENLDTELKGFIQAQQLQDLYQQTIIPLACDWILESEGIQMDQDFQEYQIEVNPAKLFEKQFLKSDIQFNQKQFEERAKENQK